MDDFEILQGEESGKEEIVRARNIFLVYDKNTKEPAFCVLMIFASLKEFRDAIVKLSLAEQRQVNFKTNSYEKAQAICAIKKYPCLMYGSYERTHKGISLENIQTKTQL